MLRKSGRSRNRNVYFLSGGRERQMEGSGYIIHRFIKNFFSETYHTSETERGND
jgi:hypothetical protein